MVDFDNTKRFFSFGKCDVNCVVICKKAHLILAILNLKLSQNKTLLTFLGLFQAKYIDSGLVINISIYKFVSSINIKLI